jgi:hypothetical protein
MDDLHAEIARLRARAAPPDPLAEIAALRARIARIEAAATQPAEGAPNMENAIHDHYRQIDPPPTRERKALERRAYGFHPDPALEQEIATRARMGADAYDAEMRRIRADAGPRILYEDRRSAALELNPDALKEGK